jgi:hypothetical protein
MQKNVLNALCVGEVVARNQEVLFHPFSRAVEYPTQSIAVDQTMPVRVHEGCLHP